MQRMIRYLASGLAGALAVIPHAHASLLGATATFTESLDIPFYRQTGPLVLQSTDRAIDGTTELTRANTVSNPSNYRGDLEATLSGATLILAADVYNDYQTITFTVENILGAPDIIDFALTSGGAIDTRPGISAPFTRTLSFTSTSLRVTYTVNDPNAGDQFFLNPNGFDTFAITTADQVDPTAIPEPGSLAIMVLGITGAGFARRRFS